MATDSDNRTIRIIASALADMGCFFIVTPEETLYLLAPNGRFINVDELPELFESFMLGIYAKPIIQLLEQYPFRDPKIELWHRVDRDPLSSFNQDERAWRHILEKYDKALTLAKKLSEKYNVHVAVLETKAEFFSAAAYDRTANEQIYFISQEDPRHSFQFTEYLLEHQARMEELREKSYFKEANAKRSEKANQTASQISEKIALIQQEYRDTHGGKEPPLSSIAEILTEQQVESPNGSTKWFAQTVKRILERSEIKR